MNVYKVQTLNKVRITLMKYLNNIEEKIALFFFLTFSSIYSIIYELSQSFISHEN